MSPKKIIGDIMIVYNYDTRCYYDDIVGFLILSCFKMSPKKTMENLLMTIIGDNMIIVLGNN